MLHRKADFLFSYERECLSGVYFGAMMPTDQILMFSSLLERTDTRLYRMHLDKARLELVPEEFTYTGTDFRKKKPIN